jgi:polyisoprenoid-binding protein YceI
MPATAVQIPPTGTYRVDPAASQITFTSRHMFGLGPVKGSFRLISGEITIADPVTASAASGVIDAASFASGNARRDQDVTSANFLHAQEHPQITFASTGLAREGEPWVLRGQITAHGISAPAELTIIEARTDEDGLLIRATTRIDRYTHGMTKKKGMAGRYGDLEITARATRT